MKTALALGMLVGLAGCVRAPTIEAQTPAMVQIFGTDPQASADMAQRACRQHGRDATMRRERQPSPYSTAMLRDYECVPAAGSR